MASSAGSPKIYGVGARIQYDVVRQGKWKCFLGIVFLVLDGLPFHLLSGVLLVEMEVTQLKTTKLAELKGCKPWALNAVPLFEDNWPLEFASATLISQLEP